MSGTGSSRVRSSASAARWSCQLPSCQAPSQPGRDHAHDGHEVRAQQPGLEVRAHAPAYGDEHWSDHLTSDQQPTYGRSMPLTPVTRRSVTDDVFDQVLAEVMDGEITAGEPLPSERRLAEVLGVSRPAVREALQRMAQTRLVDVRHGGATTVRDFARSAGLDLLPRLLVRRGQLDAAVARSVLEARLAVGPAVAALAAERGGTGLAATLAGTLDLLAATDDDVERQRHALAFWDAVVAGADSLVFQLMFNSLRAAYEPALEALAPLMAEEVGQVGAYRLLASAIGAGDPDTARAAADRVLRPATASLVAALAALEMPRTTHEPPHARGRAARRRAARRRRGAHHRPGGAASQPPAGRRLARSSGATRARG